MTSEVAILNRQCISLAADSAITSSSPNSNIKKIFNSGNKIFTLSKYEPIGIMIYGNAGLADLPFETLVKLYRKDLNKKRFNTVEDYTKNFIEYINKNSKDLFEEELEDVLFYETLGSFYVGIAEEFENIVNKLFEKHENVSLNAILDSLNKLVNVVNESLGEEEDLPVTFSFEKMKSREDIVDRLKNLINDEFNLSVYDELTNVEVLLESLLNLGFLFFNKSVSVNHNNKTGIVFVGFGETQHYPALYNIETDGLFNSKLRYRIEKKRNTEIGVNSNASLQSFAQTEVIQTFIDGIDPTILNYVLGELHSVFNSLSDKIQNTIGNLSQSNREKIETILQESFDDISGNIIKYSEQEVSRKIIEIISILPKEEMAELAETLVNLTSLKRKITFDDETVGGPIDVAVISKGDGFIWIKRKHYFDPKFNSHFFDKYFME